MDRTDPPKTKTHLALAMFPVRSFFKFGFGFRYLARTAGGGGLAGQIIGPSDYYRSCEALDL